MKPMKIPTFILLINAQAAICQISDVDNNEATPSITEYLDSKPDDNTFNQRISMIENVTIQEANEDIRDAMR